ncbi:pentatricopeptide repeat-containing protein At3g09040, mitochondrial [Selaginella moellendorffii]|uniref:pentatricopeptide repeat-containing protein At3g09040, mitochondrial n=1 Tax=Selaginella moellendorffii TaxID=88036 RepID=UPI000D1C27F2|nr:pentatricopeptide repeat-containing protein At3g09040, mitochondrial [Selaginella moellendorffii]XP_024536060.1 pentatricopeptide repeat-containing protein At3g09040, mitochondrial [Selaginella moellendorffii]|eukprot:XP_024536059.1 pentatricopeptide repeat-containing protein At3g09040, mitochondrial [Selaginella moellendorffii]
MILGRKKNWIFPSVTRSYSSLRSALVQGLLDRAEAAQDHDERCDLLASAIRECGTNTNAHDANLLHQRILAIGLGRERLLTNLTIEMYGKLGDLSRAMAAFQSIANPNAFSWTILVVAFAQNGHFLEALFFFRKMELQGIKPTIFTCAAVIGIAASSRDLALGRWMHARIVHQGLRINAVVENSLVNMYARCGSLGDAMEVFDAMLDRGVIAWTSLIAGFVQRGDHARALGLFRAMALEGVMPNDITFSSVLDACSGAGDLAQGRIAHAQILEFAAGAIDPATGAEIVAMYGRCGSLGDAERAFQTIDRPDLGLYNAMITVYAQTGRGDRALELIQQMRAREIVPDEGSFARVLSSLHDRATLERGRAIYLELAAAGSPLGVVLQTSIVKMYLNAGWIDEAAEIFSRMESRDMFSWTVMITALTERGRGREALDLFRHTRLEGLDLNRVALISALDACASLGSIKEGAHIHQEMIAALGISPDAVLGSVLVNLYGKCGSLAVASEIFAAIPRKDVVCWNAMAGAYAHHGRHAAAVEILRAAALDAIALSQVSFQCLFYSCSHQGRLREARENFHSMIGDHGVDPSDEHFRCMVDLLARAGKIDRAEELIAAMPYEPVEVAWTMILGACRVHMDVVRANRVAAMALGQPCTDVESPYILLSNMLSDEQELAL